MRCFVRAKIHGIVATDKATQYHGSVSVDTELLDAAGIHIYEQLHVINVTNGNRWITYALPAAHGAFTLNGGGARLGEIGDHFILLAYELTSDFMGARVVFCAENNSIREITEYAHS